MKKSRLNRDHDKDLDDFIEDDGLAEGIFSKNSNRLRWILIRSRGEWIIGLTKQVKIHKREFNWKTNQKKRGSAKR